MQVFQSFCLDMGHDTLANHSPRLSLHRWVFVLFVLFVLCITLPCTTLLHSTTAATLPILLLMAMHVLLATNAYTAILLLSTTVYYYDVLLATTGYQCMYCWH
jgi:hypothetical protein